VAAKEGKKLYIGASGETSYLAKRVHERLEASGKASPSDHGVREVYPSGQERAPTSAMPQEVADRVREAHPQTQREAQMAATEALEDMGGRETITRTRESLEADRLPSPPTPPEPTLPPARSKDPLDKVPLTRDDGTPKLVSPQEAARAGQREMEFADLIRECKT
jgi:hypothetical protein